MRGRHRNIFYYFRGPSKATISATAEEALQHRQIEDNTTKALINVLEHGESAVTASFLTRFVPGASLDGLAQRAYHLQGGPQKGTESAWLLGLSVLGELDPAAGGGPSQGGSRIDAAVHLPGGALVAIEVKVGEYLDPHQLSRHAKEWNMPLPPADTKAWTADDPWRLARWADVHHWVSEVAVETAEPVSRFLLDQFRRYLELVGLAPFAGFRDEHFSWLGLPQAQRSWDMQAEIKAHLRTMWEAILEGLTPDEAHCLGEIHANQLPRHATVAAAQTNWGENGVNITVELTADELQVNLVGWNASQAALLEAWLAPTGVFRSDAVLDDLELAVFRRRPYNYSKKGTGKESWWQKELFELADRRAAAELTGEPLAKLMSEWRLDADSAWEKLSYHLRRAWPRTEAVAAGVDLVPELVETVRLLLPLRDQVNPAASDMGS